MVRLLRLVLLGLVERTKGFQSHNGAIAARSHPDIHFLPDKFQSHNGAIAAFELIHNEVERHCFNPTMVRLLLEW